MIIDHTFLVAIVRDSCEPFEFEYWRRPQLKTDGERKARRKAMRKTGSRWMHGEWKSNPLDATFFDHDEAENTRGLLERHLPLSRGEYLVVTALREELAPRDKTGD